MSSYSSSNAKRFYFHDQSTHYESLEDVMEFEDTCGAVEGLLNLQRYYYNRETMGEASSSCSSSVNLTPIHPLEPVPANQRYQLPPLSNLLLTPPENDPFYQQCNCSWNSGVSSHKSTANLLYSPYDESPTTTSSTSPTMSRPTSTATTLIPPLSTSTSYSSLRSVASVRTNTKKETLLSRAATFTRRRGRPRKGMTTAIEGKNEAKFMETPQQQQQIHTNNNDPSSPSVKPRWQASEKQGLIEAIVKEKNLDDMASIRWDRISLAVGRAKKACKDQWRRELLPNLLKRGGMKSSTTHENIRKRSDNEHQQ